MPSIHSFVDDKSEAREIDSCQEAKDDKSTWFWPFGDAVPNGMKGKSPLSVIDEFGFRRSVFPLLLARRRFGLGTTASGPEKRAKSWTVDRRLRK